MTTKTLPDILRTLLSDFASMDCDDDCGDDFAEAHDAARQAVESNSLTLTMGDYAWAELWDDFMSQLERDGALTIEEGRKLKAWQTRCRKAIADCQSH